MIHGTTVVLHTKTLSGYDAFNAPIYTTTQKSVSNVIVGQVNAQEAQENLDLYGKKTLYELGIPDGDTNNWLDSDVTFFGRTFHTIGDYKQCIVENMPPVFKGRKNIVCVARDEE